jgi:hypothetical protein
MTDDVDRLIKALEPRVADPTPDAVAEQRRLLVESSTARRERAPSRPRDVRWGFGSPGRVAAVGIAASVVLLAVVGVAALTSKGDGPAHNQVTLAAPKISEEHVLTMVAPVDLADYRDATQRLISFETRISDEVTRKCLGEPGSSGRLADATPPSALLRSFDEPAVVRSVGLDATGVASPPSERSSDLQTSQQCGQEATAARAPLEAIVDPVLSAWTAEMARLETTPPVEAAWASWERCMSDEGYRFARQADLYARADDLVAHGNAAGELTKLTRAYADCLDRSGVPQARIAARRAARPAFVARQSPALRAAQSELPDVIAGLSARYGVAFPSE